jgi:hypothetical protein
VLAAYFTILVALSGKPTPFSFDRGPVVGAGGSTGAWRSHSQRACLANEQLGNGFAGKKSAPIWTVPTVGELQRPPWVWLWCVSGANIMRRWLAPSLSSCGVGSIQRQIARWRTLHLLRCRRCDPPASRLGRQSNRFIRDQHRERSGRQHCDEGQS